MNRSGENRMILDEVGFWIIFLKDVVLNSIFRVVRNVKRLFLMGLVVICLNKFDISFYF